MSDPFTLGLFAVLLGGVFQGSFLLPSKWMRGWEWENYWAIFAFSAYLLCPIAVAVVTVPDLLGVYRDAPTDVVAVTILFGFGWALGAVLFGLGAEALGMALGFSIIVGVAATSGTMIPLMIQQPLEFWSSQAGLMMVASLVVMLIGVATCSFAGRWKEAHDIPKTASTYQAGVVICISSGLLAACGGLGYAFGKPIYETLIARGTPNYLASNALYPILMPPMFLINAGYAFWLMRKNRTAGHYRRGRSGVNVILALLMGVIWLAGMACYGSGSSQLGSLGTSLGWSITLATMIMVANLLGVLSGEWNGAPIRSRWHLSLGLVILLAAIAGLGYANSLDRPASPGASTGQSVGIEKGE